MGPYDHRHTGLGWPGRGQLREDGRESVHVDPPGPLPFPEDELSGAPLLEAGREAGELLGDGAHILASPDGGRLTGGAGRRDEIGSGEFAHGVMVNGSTWSGHSVTGLRRATTSGRP